MMMMMMVCCHGRHFRVERLWMRHKSLKLQRFVFSFNLKLEVLSQSPSFGIPKGLLKPGPGSLDMVRTGNGRSGSETSVYPKTTRT